MPENGRPILSTMLSSSIGRNDAAHGLLDQIEQPSGFLDAGARLRADMHQNLTGIDCREEILAQKWPEPERQGDERDEASDHHDGTVRAASASSAR